MSLDLTLKNREINFNVTNSSQHKVYEFEEFRLDATTRLLYRSGEQVVLTPKAVETLIALIERRGEVIGKEELMQTIWADTIVEESNLAQYLHVLRKTLGETGDGKPYIETLKRRGYRFNGTVRVVKNGYGLVSATEQTQDFHEPPSEQSKAVPLVSRRVGPLGAVRALSNTAAEPETHDPVTVERSDNVYSVSDWRREPLADTPLRLVPPARSRWPSSLSLIVVTAVFAGIGFGVYKYAMSGRSEAKESIPFRESAMTRLTTAGNSRRVAISPDGKYMAYVTTSADGETLLVRQVAVANDTRVVGPSQSEFAWVTFAPDGNFIYYVTLARDKGVTELFRVPTLGGPIVKIANDIGAPTLSPDGTKLAFMRKFNEESRLIVADADGSDETVIVSRSEPDYMNMYWYAPAWSLDGKSLAFPVNQSDENGRYETVITVHVETREQRNLTNVRWQQVGQSRWLGDGLVVAASETSTGPNQLWHVSLSDGTASRITRDLNSYRHLSLTADTNTLAFVQNHTVSNIWTMGGDSTGAKQLRSEAGWLNELIWLPDGRIAYTSNAGGRSDIWTINADGTDVRQLTFEGNARLGLAVTADERQIIFSAERDGKYNLWRVDLDGSNLTQITNGSAELYPQCTPDGRWIVYQSGGNHPTIWKMPTAGGEPIAITKTTGSRPSLSPDGKLVAYHYLDSSFEKSRWGIGISDVETGERVKRFDFPPTVVERLVKWTRDGKAIAFHNSPGGIPNIWLQPFDGGNPTPLTDFPSDNIIAFNWNADGSQLAVIRGVETSDVLLVNRSQSK